MNGPGLLGAAIFYEKVVKVKADVAAILKFFSARTSRLTICTRYHRVVPIGGMRKGGFSAAL